MTLSLYGLTLAIAIFMAYYLTALRASKRRLDTEIVWDSLPWVLVFGILGARLYHVINYWSIYSQNLILAVQVWRGGLAIYGALLGGLLGALIYFRYQKPAARLQTRGEMINYLDAAAPTAALAQAIGRIGNIFNGENLPFAYWEIVTNILVLALLLFVEKVFVEKAVNLKRMGSGFLFVLYLASYSGARFILEFFRRDSPWILGPLTMAQWVSLGILAFALKKIIKSLYIWHGL